MDFYDDSLACGDRPAVLLHASSWPPAAAPLQQWRNNSRGLSKLSSIPEVSEQQLEDAKRPASYSALDDTRSTHSSNSSQQMSIGDLHDAPVLQPQQQLHVEVGEQQQDAGDHFSSSKGMHSRTCSGSGSAAEDNSSAADATTAAAATWVSNIRHFTDCVPISPDSLCSSSTYCSLMVGVKDNSSGDTAAHLQQQQPQAQPQQVVHPAVTRQSQPSPFADVPAAAAPCSLPNSSSSASLVPTSSSAAADEAAVKASLLEALHELDELEFLPFDRVAQWLEAQAAAAAAAAASTSSSTNLLTSTSDDDDSSDEQQQQAAMVVSNTSDHAASSSSDATAASPSQLQQEGTEALFDAPDWWQEAVLARLQQQRDAFQGSWWSRAKVFAALAAQKAACALQI